MVMKVVGGTFSLSNAIKKFGINNLNSSRAFKLQPVTTKEFALVGGDLAKSSEPDTLKSSSNRITPKAEDFLKLNIKDVNERITTKANPISFSLRNQNKYPFDFQGNVLNVIESESSKGRNINLKV
jgi:hypothetical protein